MKQITLTIILTSVALLFGCGEKSPVELRVEMLEPIIVSTNGYGQDGLDLLVLPDMGSFIRQMLDQGDSVRTASHVWMATLQWAEEIPTKEYQSLFIKELSQVFTQEEIQLFANKTVTDHMRGQLLIALNNTRDSLLKKYMDRLDELQNAARNK